MAESRQPTEERLALAFARLREGTEILRTGGGTSLTAEQCNLLLDWAVAQREALKIAERKANEKLSYPLVCRNCEDLVEAARESVRREAASDYGSIYEAPTRIIGPIRDALSRFDAAVSGPRED